MNNSFWSKINKHSFKSFRQYLAMKGASFRSIKRKESSLKKFFSWAVKEGYLKENSLPKEMGKWQMAKREKLKFSIFSPVRYTLSAICSHRAYRALPFFTYLNFLILLLFAAALGFGIYQQFIKKAPEKLAYPAGPVVPNRYLSFQGRLTDSADTPITTATNMRFRLYDAGSGGNVLWDSDTCVIDPDQDGIFNTLLGSDCGPAIPASVFSENAQVWLGITVGSDSEATPRIQIATVAYALNAETLQGFPLASETNTNPEATMGATARTVPVINPAGNLVIAAASPTLWSTSGTFAVKGQALSIVTENAGNITIAPDTSGVLNLTLSAGSGNVINATDANLGSSGGKEANTLLYGSVANDNTNFNLLKLESGSSPTPKFTVDAQGNASAAGVLRALGSGNNYLAGNLGIGTTSPSSLFSVGSSSQFQVDSSGDMVKIKNLTYSWPTSHTTNGVLTNDGSGNLTWTTIGSGGITPDSLDFTEFQDTLDLDADLTLNQGTYTWTQNFTGTTTTGLTYNANSLTSGTGLAILSSSTGLTGDLVKIEASGNNAGVTGNALKVGLTGTSATGTALNITTAGSSGFALRVNDDGTYTDSSPFVVDSTGNVGIGTTSPGARLDVKGLTTAASNILSYKEGLARASESTYHLGAYSTRNLRTGPSIYLSEARNALAVIYRYVGADSAYWDETRTLGEWGGSARTTLADTSDILYFGRSGTFTELYFDIVTAGAGYSLVWEYWNGSAWSSLSVTDGTSGFSTDGWVTWTAPEDWATTTVGPDTTARYYLRVRTTAAPSTVATAYYANIGGFNSYFIQGLSQDRSKFYVDTYGQIVSNVSEGRTPFIGYRYEPRITGLGGSGFYYGSQRNIDSVTGLYINSANWSLDYIFFYDGATAGYTNTTVNREWGAAAFSLHDATNDYLYLGDESKFSEVYFDIGTAGVGYSLVWEYWNGSAWTSLTVSDGTKGFSKDGWVFWTAPSDWATTAVNEQTKYWIRVRTTATPSTVATTSFVNISGFSGYFTRFFAHNYEKLRIDTRGRLYLAGPIYPGTGADGGSVQTTNYLAGTATGIGIGTTNPYTQLEASKADISYWNGASAWTGDGIPHALTITNTYPGGYDPVVLFRMTDSGGTSKNAGAIGLVRRSSWTAENDDSQISDMYLAVRNNSGGISERMRITYDGNVGIGTTSPLQKLHVEGQCVTGDSKLITEEGKELRVDEVKGGERIYSLDEKTGRLVLAQIKALLDMGWQPTFELKTEDGKRIVTTGNHPYLAKKQESFGAFGRSSQEGNINQHSRNYIQSKHNGAGTEESINVNIHNSFDLTSKSNNPNTKLSIAGSKLNVNKVMNFSQETPKSPGEISNIPSQPEARLIDKSANAEAKVERETNLISSTLLEENPYVKPTGIWTKVVYLSVGDEIAVADKDLKGIRWVKILSIKPAGIRHVWDLSIEGTHNFVANGIIAHNTYINSTDTTANVKGLEVSQSGAVTGTGYGLYVTKTGTSTTNVAGYFSATGATNNYGLIVENGNVGIGTTNPSTFKLEVAGNIGPEATGTRDLGSSTRAWNNVYALNYYQGANLLGLWLDGGTYIYPGNVGTSFQIADSTGNLSTAGTASFNSGGVTIDSSNYVNAARFVDTAGSGNYFLDPAGAASLNIAGYATTSASLAVGYSSVPSGPGNAVFRGNVGIGTTSPAQKLHVEGQCVTGDTVLSTVPADQVESGRVDRSQLTVHGVQIKDVKQGTYVYSLNQKTGKIEPARIKRLLDMGVKPVFKLTTESGKVIKTTGNHPYLVQLTQDEYEQRVQLRETGYLERKYGLGQDDLSVTREFSQTREVWSYGSASQSGNLNTAEHSGRERQVLQQGVYSVSLSGQRESLRSGGLSQTGAGIRVSNRDSSQITTSTDSPDQSNDGWSGQLPQEIRWTKVIYLSPGDKIAVVSDSVHRSQITDHSKDNSCEPRTVNGEPASEAGNISEPSTVNCEPYVVWDKIQSIEYVGEEQVYDIEVEGTHNFVANGILAHNTYISGNVGIGTTGPGYKLTVAGTGKFTSDLFYDTNIRGDQSDNWDYATMNGSNPTLDFAWLEKPVDILQFKSATNLEYWDGANWVSWSTTDWQNVLDGRPDTAWSIDSTHKKFRFVVNVGAWTHGGQVVVFQEYSTGTRTYTLTVESSSDNGATDPWTQLGQGTFSSYWARLSINNPSGDGYLRFTFDTDVSTYNMSIRNIKYYTMRKSYVGNLNLPLYWNWNGNVGIGTTAPGYKLHVIGDIYANGGWLRTSGTAGWYSESYGGGWYMSDTSWIRTYNSKSVWTNTGLLGSNGGLTIGYGGATPPSGGAIIAGNVGIGTTGPQEKLSIASGNIQLENPTSLSKTFGRIYRTSVVISNFPLLKIVSFRNTLYGAKSFDLNDPNLYRYDGGTTWTSVGNACGGTTNYRPSHLVVYENKLIIACHDNSSGNPNYFYSYDGTSFTYIGNATSYYASVSSMIIYQNKLYAHIVGGSNYRYDGGTTWTSVGNTFWWGGYGIINGYLYNNPDTNSLYRYNGGTSWTAISFPNSVGSPPIEFNGKLVVGQKGSSNLIFYDPITGTYTTVSTPASSFSGSNIDRIVYKGFLYIGDYKTNPCLYRFEGIGASPSWTTIACFQNEGGIGNFIEFNGDLYFLTSNRGYKYTDFETSYQLANFLDVSENGYLSVRGGITNAGNLRVGINTLFADTISGNVGIGTTGPSDKLEIGGGGALRFKNTAGGYDMRFYPGGVSATYGYSYLKLIPSGADANYPHMKLVLDTTSGKSGLILSSAGSFNAQFAMGTNNNLYIDNYIGAANDLYYQIMRFGSTYTERFKFRGDGWGFADLGWTTFSPYLSYNYIPPEKQKSDYQLGEIVKLSKINRWTVEQTDKPYQKSLHGVVVLPKGFISIPEELREILKDNKVKIEDLDLIPIAQLGEAPVLVSSVNGPISPGDPITSSELPGIGMKATMTGPIVGKALESTEHWNEQNCPIVSSLEAIQWPEDDGSNPAKPCFRLPDGTYVGKIMAFVNVSWYDPDVYLTSTGDLKITRLEAEGNETDSDRFQLTTTAGQVIERIGAFSEIAVGKIRAGLTETQELLAEAIKAKEIISETLSSIQVNTEKVVSPLAEITKIKTEVISPLPDSSDVTIRLGKETKDTPSESGFGKLLVQNAQGETVASIDSEGNASFSGQITSRQLLVAGDATVSGTLYAEEIITKHGKFGDLLANEITTSTVSAQYITYINNIEQNNIEQNIYNIYNIIQNNEPSPTPTPELTGTDPVMPTPSPLPSPEPVETPSATESGLLDEASSWELSDVANDLPPESISLNEDEIRVNQNFKVLGKSSLASLTVAGTFSQDGSLIIDQGNSLNVITGTLYLQNLGFGGVDILAGKVIIDVEGNIQVSGNLAVGGEISTAKLTLKEKEEENKASENGFGKLLAVLNKEGTEVASIDASGSASFASLTIAADYSATQSATLAQIYTNATSGLGILPAGRTEFTVFNPKVSENTLIYLTPVSDTENKVLFVKAKKAGQWFKVGIDSPIEKEIKFNWWIIN